MCGAGRRLCDAERASISEPEKTQRKREREREGERRAEHGSAAKTNRSDDRRYANVYT